MKVRELIEELKKFNPELDIMILDGFNGGGEPREINLGPTPHTITATDVETCADCEDVGEGTCVVVMGFGCY